MVAGRQPGSISMDWYSIFVTTGKEEYVTEWLDFYFITSELTALIPKRKLFERKAGKTIQVVKKMFPGYVLINTEMDVEAYYKLKKIPNLIHILKTGEYFTKISKEEMACIHQLLGQGDVVDCSEIYLADSKVIVKSGPLQGMEGLIKAVDKRKQRVKIVIQFMGLEKEIAVGIEVLESAFFNK